ncbi:MAG: OB-fold putative lipoprotein [Myxococcales bacterium]|nr:OB-fold putative lipoprotein [Myxococcales bacterium]
MEEDRLQSLGVRWGSFLLVAITACGPSLETVRLDELLTASRGNAIKAHETYEDKYLKVTGTVEHVGLQTKRQRVATLEYMAPTPTAVEHVRTKKYGYVILMPQDPSEGRLLCYFHPNDRGPLAEISPGQRIEVVGWFKQFRQEPVGRVVELSNCTTEQ